MRTTSFLKACRPVFPLRPPRHRGGLLLSMRAKGRDSRSSPRPSRGRAWPRPRPLRPRRCGPPPKWPEDQQRRSVQRAASHSPCRRALLRRRVRSGGARARSAYGLTLGHGRSPVHQLPLTHSWLTPPIHSGPEINLSVVDLAGFEPTTPELQPRCSSVELKASPISIALEPASEPGPSL